MSASDKNKNANQNAGASGERVLDPVLLNILVCPQSLGTLEYDRKNQELICKQSGLAYPIRDGVPILLIAEARKVDASHRDAPYLDADDG